MADLSDKLALTQELHAIERTPFVLFAARVVERGLQQVAAASWATASRSLDPVGTPVHRVRGEGSDHVIAERNGTLVHLSIFSGWIQAQVAADDAERAASVLGELKELFPPPDPSSAHSMGAMAKTTISLTRIADRPPATAMVKASRA